MPSVFSVSPCPNVRSARDSWSPGWVAISLFLVAWPQLRDTFCSAWVCLHVTCKNVSLVELRSFTRSQGGQGGREVLHASHTP